MKKIIAKLKKLIFYNLILFLLFFNLNLILEENGWSIILLKDIVAKEALPPGDGGGGSSKPTRFYNYGTQTETVYCQKSTIGSNGVVSITFYTATVYWMIENCLYGGNTVECTYNTQRKTYQGGGC